MPFAYTRLDRLVCRKGRMAHILDNTCPIAFVHISIQPISVYDDVIPQNILYLSPSLLSMSSGATAQDQPWKTREQAQEAQYIRDKEQTQLGAIRDQLKKDNNVKEDVAIQKDNDFEGGFGGQEDLEDRYATTSGEH